MIKRSLPFIFAAVLIAASVHAQAPRSVLGGVTPPIAAGTNTIGTVRITPAATGYTTDYNTGLFVPKQTTDTVANQTATASPTLVMTIVLNNVTSTAATVTVGDGTSNVLTAFSIPGNSMISGNFQNGLVLGKIVISQGTTSSIVAYFGGKQ